MTATDGGRHEINNDYIEIAISGVQSEYVKPQHDVLSAQPNSERAIPKKIIRLRHEKNTGSMLNAVQLWLDLLARCASWKDERKDCSRSKGGNTGTTSFLLTNKDT